MPTEAYIYDAIRTPRGRGKANGSLHEVRPLDLLKTLFDEMRVRYDLDTSQVDDVLLGCVTPVIRIGPELPTTSFDNTESCVGVVSRRVIRWR